MKIFHLPIEPYETRYTKDWIDQFEQEFNEYGVDFVTVLGQTTTDKLKQGTVLDCCGTNYYKSTQLANMIQLINKGEVCDDDVIFVCDLWFPGIESLFYIRNLTGIRFKVYGILHAGTWDEYDFTYTSGMRSWAQHFEQCFLNAADGIFVATEFHKKLILDSFESWSRSISEKIHVTGIPFYAKNIHKYASKKENIIVFPHRNADEKKPQLFSILASRVGNELPNFKCINTFDVCKTREDYFKLLGKSKYMVSFALQETFGYSTVEAMALQCCVIVPDRLSYVETVPPQHRYQNTAGYDAQEVNSAFKLIKHFEENHVREYNYYPYLHKWTMSVYNMLEIISQDIRKEPHVL